MPANPNSDLTLKATPFEVSEYLLVITKIFIDYKFIDYKLYSLKRNHQHYTTL